MVRVPVELQIIHVVKVRLNCCFASEAQSGGISASELYF